MVDAAGLLSDVYVLFMKSVIRISVKFLRENLNNPLFSSTKTVRISTHLNCTNSGPVFLLIGNRLLVKAGHLKSLVCPCFFTDKITFILDTLKYGRSLTYSKEVSRPAFPLNCCRCTVPRQLIFLHESQIVMQFPQNCCHFTLSIHLFASKSNYDEVPSKLLQRHPTLLLCENFKTLNHGNYFSS